MKILVSGGTGFIGQKLIPELRVRGHSVTVLTRSIEKAKKIFGPAVHCVSMNSDLPRVDGVVHLAGESIAQRWTADAKARIKNSRVAGTRRLIDRVKSPDLQFFISASAVGYYGDRGNEQLTETSVAGTGFLADVCMLWEHEVLERADLKARKAVLRTAPVLGGGGGILKKLVVPFRVGLGPKLGHGDQWMSWVHIDDIVAMYVRLAEDASLRGVFVGAAPEPVTNSHFTHALAETLNRPTFLSIPRWALRLGLGELGEALLASAGVRPERFLALRFPFQFKRIESAFHHILGGKFDRTVEGTGIPAHVRPD